MPGSTPSMSEQPTKNPSLDASRDVLEPSTTTWRPRRRRGHVGPHPVAVLAGDERAHHRGVARSPGPTTTSGMRAAMASTSGSAAEPTATTTEIAMHRSPADPYAGRDRGVGRGVDVGVGQHDHVVLGPAERLHPLAVAACPSRRRGARSACCPRTTSRRRRGGSAARSTASASPCTTCADAIGEARVVHQFGQQHRRRRVLLRRLEHERVAARERVGEHPERHHHREVERRDAGTTPTGCSTVCTSMPVETSRLCEPFSRCGTPQANSTQSRPRATSPRGVVEHLAVLARDRSPPARRGARRPARAGGTSPRLRRLNGESRHSAAAADATFTAASTSAADANATSAVCTPRAGSKTAPRRAASPSTRRPPIQCPMVFTRCRPAVRRCVQRR